MKKLEKIEVYICDCCGKKSLEGWSRMLQGCNYGSDGVEFEPKVLGDYCEDCIKYAQQNWDNMNTSGFVSERYDSYSDENFSSEVANMRLARKNEFKLNYGEFWEDFYVGTN